MQQVYVRLPGRPADYKIIIGEGVLDRLGDATRNCLGNSAHRVAIISNQKVFDLYGARAKRSLRAAAFSVEQWLMGDGERYKSLRTLERALQFLSEIKLERSDAVVALGGGVVGDLAGFAAALYLRGIAFLPVPTTLLAQVDASVGGKVAVNTSFGKNLVGVFHQPRLVSIDTTTLETLPQRELTAGWCEAVKQGAAGSRKLFDATCDFLRNVSSRKQISENKFLDELIAAQCAFKASIVAVDEREDVQRSDHRSRRILNFGHTTAHALETVTRYRRFRHGEAVGYGMIAAAEISLRLGLLDVSELELLREAVRLCGPLPRADDLDESAILSAFAHDKKNVNGSVNWVLLERMGRARIVNGKEIAPRLIRASINAALRSLEIK